MATETSERFFKTSGINRIVPPPRFSLEGLRLLIPGQELSDFRRLINPEDLTSKQQREITHIISKLYAQTQNNPDLRIREQVGSMWKPTYCQRAILALSLLRDITSHSVFIVDGRARHRWIEMDFLNSITVIIDSAGLPPTQEHVDQIQQLREEFSPDKEQMKALVQSYQPYFGRKDSVSGVIHREVYESGRRLSQEEIVEELKILNDRLTGSRRFAFC